MTEYTPAVEMPDNLEVVNAEHRRLQRLRKVGGYLWDTVVEAFEEDRRRYIAATLAVVGAVSTAAQFGHWMDHDGLAAEYFVGSGRHGLPGYAGAMLAIAGSKAETLGGKIIAGAAGAVLGDFAAEAMQSAVTGIMHGGSLHDMMGFLPPRGLTKDNWQDGETAFALGALGTVENIVEN